MLTQKYYFYYEPRKKGGGFFMKTLNEDQDTTPHADTTTYTIIPRMYVDV